MDKTPDQAALETLAHTREIAGRTHDMVHELRAWLEATQTPATPKIIELTQAVPVVTDDSKTVAASVGVYNPNGFTVYFAPSGGRASKGARAYPAPANSIIVLPVAASTVELGVDPADQGSLAAGSAVVFLFRFDGVQPAALAKAV